MSDAAPEHGGDMIPPALEKKIGPLPVGVWVLAIAGGLAVAYYMRQRASSAAPVAVTDNTGDFGDGLDNTQAGAGNLGNTASNPTADGTPADGGTLSFTDNDSWLRQAVIVLGAFGIPNLTASNALNDYLSGVKLTTAEAAIVELALQKAGPPPVTPPTPDSGQTNTPTPAPTSSSKPATGGTAKPAPKPVKKPAAATYTIRGGDTLSEIAQAHHTTTAALYSKNAAVLNAAAKHHGKSSSEGGHWIYPGTVIKL